MNRFISSAFAISAEGAIFQCLKTMPKGKIAAIVTFPLLLVQSIFIPAAMALDENKLYQLCSSFPLNSQCKGYEVPVPLDKRSGNKGECIFKNDDLENRGLCKINVNETGITIYQETGKKLEIINDKKTTRTIQITPTKVSQIEYREDEINNTDAKIVNTILFGLPGLLLTPNKKVSEIQLNYTSTSTQDTSQQNQSVESLRVFVGRETGREMRSQLEKITGLQAETPQAK